MLSIYDIDGFVDELGSVEMLSLLEQFAIDNNLSNTKRFLQLGFSIEKEKMIKELEKINYNYTELSDSIEKLIDLTEKSKEIVIIRE